MKHEEDEYLEFNENEDGESLYYDDDEDVKTLYFDGFSLGIKRSLAYDILLTADELAEWLESAAKMIRLGHTRMDIEHPCYGGQWVAHQATHREALPGEDDEDYDDYDDDDL